MKKYGVDCINNPADHSVLMWNITWIHVCD